MNENCGINVPKPILDACCGPRMFWFDKQNPNCLYIDKRELPPTTVCDGRTVSVKPDVIADFTNLPFEDESYYLVVFDPPHLVRAGDSSYMAVKYGKLGASWEEDLKKGFEECMRVLKPYGTLIFKWAETQVLVSKIINIIGQQPLFGHKSGKYNKTHWMAFMKFPQ